MPERLAHALVVLTRPEGRNEPLAQRLGKLGIESLAMPVLKIDPAPAIDGLPRPEDYDLIVFVSGNAVSYYFQQLMRAGVQPTQWPAHVRVAVVGAATAVAVEQTGLVPARAIVCPHAADAQDSESLWKVLQPQTRTMRKALIVRGQDGREWLGGHLENAGIKVDRHTAYLRCPLDWSPSVLQRLRAAAESGRTVICLLTSSHSVDIFVQNALRHDLLGACAAFRYVVIHPRVAGRLQSSLGAASGKVDFRAVTICQPTDDAVVQAVASLASI